MFGLIHTPASRFPYKKNTTSTPMPLRFLPKHPATVILVLTRELILFVMRCLMCCCVGSRDSVTEYPIGGHLWLSMPHYLLTGHFMLTTVRHYMAHLMRGNGFQRWIQRYRTMHTYSQLSAQWQLELLGFWMLAWFECCITAADIVYHHHFQPILLL